MQLTVLLVTYRRADWLERCLRSLRDASAQNGAALRLLVGINGRDPEGLRIANRAGAEVHEFGTRISPAAARNVLLQKEKSGWVFFVDDDAYVDSDFFVRFQQTLAEFPKAAVIGGPNLTPPGSKRFQQDVGAVLSSRLATYSSSARYQAKGKSRETGENGLILCNLFVRREVLDSHPFPENFWCGEENWMIQTLQTRDHQLIYDPRLSVWHERRGRFLEFVIQIFHYGSGRGRNIRGRPAVLNIIHLIPSFCVLVGLLFLMRWMRLRSLDLSFVALLIVYGFVCVIAAFRQSRSFAQGLRLSPLFVVIHTMYGVGVLNGLVRGVGSEGRK